MSDQVWIVFRQEPYESESLVGVFASERGAWTRATELIRKLGGARWKRGVDFTDLSVGVQTHSGESVRIDRHTVEP